MFRSIRIAACVGVAVFAASCSSDSETASTTPATAAVGGTVAAEAESAGFSAASAGGATVTLDAQPMRIISLPPTHTEVLFAIGAGAQVIAVDDQSNYPAEAAAVTSTLSGFTPNIEAIAAFKPDLVVIADDFNGVIPQLEKVNIPVWSGATPSTLDDAYAQIEQLGVLTGHTAEAVAVSSKMSDDVARIVASIPAAATPLTFYHELDSTYFSATSNTFIGELYSLVGLQNVADTAEAGNDYPQLSAEFIVSADPDFIFLADAKCCAQTPETVAARDGWAAMKAVANGNVVAMDDDISSRWGPRAVDYLQAIADAVNRAAVAAG